MLLEYMLLQWLKGEHWTAVLVFTEYDSRSRMGSVCIPCNAENSTCLGLTTWWWHAQLCLFDVRKVFNQALGYKLSCRACTWHRGSIDRAWMRNSPGDASRSCIDVVGRLRFPTCVNTPFSLKSSLCMAMPLTPLRYPQSMLDPVRWVANTTNGVAGAGHGFRLDGAGVQSLRGRGRYDLKGGDDVTLA